MIDARQTFQLKTLSPPANRLDFTLEWQVPEHMAYLDGHFPGNPVLPAVGIIDGTLEFIRQALNNEVIDLQKIISAKFSAPITPKMQLVVQFKKISPNEWIAVWLNRDGLAENKALAEIRFCLHGE